ncbi:hypothetical protein HBH61_025550 [Parastagonospora nodorum]|nr:hypothetical protein HBH61_025550 [Parastagonospora nodorum]
MLQLLKKACYSLKGCSKCSKFRAIYKIILQFKAILKAYKTILKTFKQVNYNKPNAPKDYLAINLRAA